MLTERERRRRKDERSGGFSMGPERKDRSMGPERKPRSENCLEGWRGTEKKEVELSKEAAEEQEEEEEAEERSVERAVDAFALTEAPEMEWKAVGDGPEEGRKVKEWPKPSSGGSEGGGEEEEEEKQWVSFAKPLPMEKMEERRRRRDGEMGGGKRNWRVDFGGRGQVGGRGWEVI